MEMPVARCRCRSRRRSQSVQSCNYPQKDSRPRQTNAKPVQQLADVLDRIKRQQATGSRLVVLERKEVSAKLPGLRERGRFLPGDGTATGNQPGLQAWPMIHGRPGPGPILRTQEHGRLLKAPIDAQCSGQWPHSTSGHMQHVQSMVICRYICTYTLRASVRTVHLSQYLPAYFSTPYFDVRT